MRPPGPSRFLGCVGRLRGLVASVVLACALALAFGRSVAGEPAPLRIIAHPEFARLVLPAPSARAEALELVGRTAHLRLDRPQPILVPPIPAAARSWLLAAESREAGGRLALALAPDVEARLVEPGPGRIVVDLARGGSRAEPTPGEAVPAASPSRPALEQGPPRAPLRVRTGTHAGFRRVVLEGPGAGGLDLRLDAGRIEIGGARETLPPIADALRRLGPHVVAVAVEPERLRAELAPGGRAIRRTARPDQIVLDLELPSASTSRSPPAGRAESSPPGAPSAPAQATAPRGGSPAGRSRAEPSTIATSPPPLPPGACSVQRAAASLCIAVDGTAEAAEVALVLEPRPGAAVLWRAGALWVVLDRVVDTVTIEPPATNGLHGLVREIRREPHPTATLLRIATAAPVAAEAEPGARGWHLRLRPMVGEPAAAEGRLVRLDDPPALAIEADASLLTLPASIFASEVSLLAARERLPGSGPRRFVDLEVLATAQGVAWRAVSDDLRVRRVGGRWVIDRPGGLRLAPLTAGGAAPTLPPTPPAATEPPLGPAEATVAGALAEAPVLPADAPRTATAARPVPPATGADAPSPGPDGEPELGARSGGPRPSPTPSTAPRAPPAAVSAPSSDRSPAQPLATPIDRADRTLATAPAAEEPPIGLVHLAAGGEKDQAAPSAALLDRRAAAPEVRAAVERRLARRALAEGKAAEALALLGEPAAASDLAAEPPADRAARALAGVAAVLLDRLAAGERLLDDPRLSGDAEVALWRAIAAARAGDWPRAARALAASGRSLQSYPPTLVRRLAPLVARILVEDGKAAAALAVLDLARRYDPGPRDAARLALVEGLALLRQAARAEAEAAWRAAAEGGDPIAAIEARYRLARLRHDGSDPGPLLAELGRQRLLWRDHPAEPEMLAGLAELLAGAEREGEALAVARELLARHPGAKPAQALAGRLQLWFAAAIEGGGDRPPEPVAALRVLRAHADLLPPDEAGMGLARSLARRLAAAGLPGAAASVLVEHGLPRASRAMRGELVLEAAELRLRADDPEGALALLGAEADALSASPPLQARAELLRRAARGAGGGTPLVEAAASPDLARLEAAWRQRDWAAVAEVGTALLAQAASTDAELSRLALRVAVALAAAGRKAEAGELIARYRPSAEAANAAGIGGRLFDLLASRSGLGGDALEVAAAIDGELALLRAGLGR